MKRLRRFLWKVEYTLLYGLNNTLDDLSEYYEARGLPEPRWNLNVFWWTKERLKPFLDSENQWIPPSLPGWYLWLYWKYDRWNDRAMFRRWQKEEADHPFVPQPGAGGFLIPDELVKDLQEHAITGQGIVAANRRIIPALKGDSPAHLSLAYPPWLIRAWRDSHEDPPFPIDTSTS